MTVRSECRHYSTRTIGGGPDEQRIERCRIGCNEPVPFGCPADCLFFEARGGSISVGWTQPPG